MQISWEAILTIWAPKTEKLFFGDSRFSRSYHTLFGRQICRMFSDNFRVIRPLQARLERFKRESQKRLNRRGAAWLCGTQPPGRVRCPGTFQPISHDRHATGHDRSNRRIFPAGRDRVIGG